MIHTSHLSTNELPSSQQQSPSQNPYTFIISLVLSFALGSTLLLGATLLLHSDFALDMIIEVHSSMIGYLGKIPLVNRFQDYGRGTACMAF